MKTPELCHATYGVTSTGNMRALTLMLSSVILQTLKPQKVLIRLEGEYPSTNDFYFEQLLDLGRVFGMEFTLCVANSNGVREARDWLVDNCKTDWLWMGDDDVVYDPACFAELWKAREIATHDVQFGFVQGAKPDVNNRRGYGDFSKKPRTVDDLEPCCSYNQFYYIAPPYDKVRVTKTRTADTGNLLLNVELLRLQEIRFTQFEVNANASGEDTLFAGAIANKGLVGYFCPTATGVHLEKPSGGFNEFGARTELLYRAFEKKCYDTALLDDFMPFQKRYRSLV